MPPRLSSNLTASHHSTVITSGQPIAAHTSPEVPENISALARLLRQAKLIDFREPPNDVTPALEAEIEQRELQLPRMNIEKRLEDAIVDEAVAQPSKAPTASWQGFLLRAKRENADWAGVNPDLHML
jgi:hypothetical protein